MNEAAGLISGAVFISLIHAAMPTHWLPFVLVGRARKWSRGRVMAVAAAAGVGHVAMTIVLGFIVFLAGFKLAEYAGHNVRIISGGLLIVFGLIFLANYLFHRDHSHGHEHKDFITDRAAIISLLGMLTFSPCEAILPVFLAAGTVGWKTVIPLLFIILTATVGVMLFFVYVAAKSMERIKSKFFERYENLFVGAVLLLLGLLVIFVFE